MNDRLKTFRQELLDELEHDILPFWIERVMAPAESRFYGRIGGDGRLYPDADQSAVLYGRLVWTFSAAYRMTGRRELLAAATCARNYLLDHFIDPEYGGVYWSVHADGTPADMRKQFYALGFAIYGLSEYARATGDERSAKEEKIVLREKIRIASETDGERPQKNFRSGVMNAEPVSPASTFHL